jgi:hypothetical protein
VRRLVVWTSRRRTGQALSGRRNGNRVSTGSLPLVSYVCLIRDFESFATRNHHSKIRQPMHYSTTKPVPNFTRLDRSRPEIAILMDAMLRAREVVAARSWATSQERHRLIRFRHFCSGSLALASLNLACRNLGSGDVQLLTTATRGRESRISRPH